MNEILVAAGDDASQAWAKSLADRLNLRLLPALTSPRSIQEPAVLLVASEGGLSLQLAGKNAPGPVSVDFGDPAMRHRRRSGQNEMLGRAVGVGKKAELSVLDATAGLARDSFVMADLGCHVQLCERHPIISELLAESLERALQSGDEWLSSVAGRLQLFPDDARQIDTSLLREIDVIYLDPMFPARKKSANVKKEMALFQSLLDEAKSEPDAADLLIWSLEQEVARVVVKRPAKAPILAGRKPAHAITGKSVRYDVYVLAALK